MPYLVNSFPRHLLILLIFFTPLAFGSVHTWAYASMELITLTLVTIWVIKTILNPNDMKWVKTPVCILMALFSAYIFLQTIPISDRIIQSVSPTRSEISQKLDSVLGAENPSRSESSLSLNPHRSKIELLKLLAYFGVFLFIINNIRSRKQINQIVITLIGMGVFESLYGIVQKTSGAHKILWWENIFGSGRISGTFINPDHLAGFLEMIILLNIGYVISLDRRRRRRHREKQTWRLTLSGFFSRERNLQLLFIYPIAIMLIGLFLTASRGGLIAFAVGLSVIIMLSVRQLRLQSTFTLFALIGLFLFTFGAGLKEQTVTKISNRYKTLFTPGTIDQVRLDIYTSLKPLIGDFPIVGTGWGTFSDVYPKYQPKTLSLFFTNAHNDWLELLVETGVIGLTLVVIMMFFYFYRFIRLWATRNDPYAIGIGLGVLGSSAAIITHSFVDFNLHIPANAFLLAVILGVGFAAIHNQKHHKNETTFAQMRIFKPSFLLRWSLISIAVFGFFFLGKQVVYRFLAEVNCPTEINSTLKLSRVPSIDKIRQALDYEPNNPDCLVKLIPVYRKSKELEPTRHSRKLYTEKNIKTLEQALRLNPVRARYYALLGREYLELSLLDSRNGEKLVNKFAKSYKNAAYFDPREYEQSLREMGKF